MEIRADEISRIIREQIKDYGKKVDVAETGSVLSQADGVARIYGLAGAAAGLVLAGCSAEPRGAVPLARSRWLARTLYALEAGDGDLVARLLVAGAPPPCGVPSDTAVDRAYVELREAPL